MTNNALEALVVLVLMPSVVVRKSGPRDTRVIDGVAAVVNGDVILFSKLQEVWVRVNGPCARFTDRGMIDTRSKRARLPH